MLRARTLVVILPVLAACGAPSLIHAKPDDPIRNQAVTAMWARDIGEIARDGDWILTRSYSAIGDVIAIGTSGPDISHASIYDAERNMVIEAVSSGVREVPLDELLERNRTVIVIRPRGLDDAARRTSVLRARSVIGRSFDVAGMFGLDVSERFYCSELVVWASGIELDDRVITPAQLIEHGELLYVSGHRDSRELQDFALAAHHRRLLATSALDQKFGSRR